VRFSRRKSELHEAQLNLNLLKPFNIALNDDLNYLHDRMGLRPADPLPAHLRSILQPNKFNLIVHPFSNGHAREWPISHFIALINQLPRDKIHVIISGSQKESEAIQNKMMTQCSDVTDISGRCDLHEFIQLIAHADGLIANSTGPLHLAAVFNIHALGLYPITKGIDPNRWAPIGKKAEFLTVDPNCNAPSCRDINDCVCMESITVEMVKNKVLGWSS
jgi:ADP-heptose:LPS heptosyltransferase